MTQFLKKCRRAYVSIWVTVCPEYTKVLSCLMCTVWHLPVLFQRPSGQSTQQHRSKSHADRQEVTNHIGQITYRPSVCNFSVRHRVNEIAVLLGCYAAWIGGWFPTFRDNLSVPFARVKQSGKKLLGAWPFLSDCLTVEDLTDRLSRKVCNKLSV
jgi:hypothetical protein